MQHTVNKFSSHPEGMLDRDQRTIFIVKTKSNEMIRLNCTAYCCDDCKPRYFDIRKNGINLNVNCDHYANSNSFRKKKVTRFFQKLNKYLLALFCIWILTSQHFQPKTVMAMPVHMSSEYNKHPKSLTTLKLFLNNPCGFEAQTSASDSSDSRPKPTFDLNNKDVKFYLGKIESSAKTGLSDFKTGYLKNFLLTDFNIPHALLDQKIAGHHEAWKHQSNPNLLPKGKHLEIEFLKDLSDATKRFAEESARKFNVENDDDRQQLLKILEDCDERLQRLLVVFYQMHQNLDNFRINFRQNDFATDNIRKVYAKAIDIIRNGLCDVRTALHKLYEVSGTENGPVHIVDVEYILNNPFKTDSIGDWVNVRQLHDQLEFMTQIFGIWVNEIHETK